MATRIPMPAFPYPFNGTIEELAKIQEEIPIHPAVKGSFEFKRLVDAGEAWGPQASDQSKLATRLWYAGWTRKQLEEFGLKPKDVENWRRYKGLTEAKAGRPSRVYPKFHADANELSPIGALQARIEWLELRKAKAEEDIKEATETLTECDEEIAKLQKALEVLGE